MRFLFLFAIFGLLTFPSTRTWSEEPGLALAKDLSPWLPCLTGKQNTFRVRGSGKIQVDGKLQDLQILLARHDEESFDLELTHPEYAVHFRRRVDGMAMALPKHKVVYLGDGTVDVNDNLKPQGLTSRLIGNGTALQLVARLLTNSDPEELSNAILGLAKLELDPATNAWTHGKSQLQFRDSGRTIEGTIDGSTFSLQLDSSPETPVSWNIWPEYQQHVIPRKDLELQLTRGLRRGYEVALPSTRLTSPPKTEREVEHGAVRWIDGSRVVVLHGTPEEIGTAHGKLLKSEAMRCIDSVVYMFGTIQTIATGRWFRDDLEQAYKRLSPHIPERHKVETRALAVSLGVDQQLLETTNVFPELFHCSGFALFGSATKDGKLYHGRVLDYMTMIGLQDSATTFIVAPEGKIPFANVGYAGFIGSVSGMNAEKISLGEMGGRGEGQWDGAPMATLMRRALEECRSLDEVKELWTKSPRTCEYYYVFADGETKTAVGVAATPDKIEFVQPGQAHPLLGDGISDAVVLSAGSRLEELRSRVKKNLGKIDVEIAQSLMCRPVAMSSNLHNVLFVPEDGLLYVANADHQHPAAERPYSKLDLVALLKNIEKKAPNAPIETTSQFRARDSFQPVKDNLSDANDCIRGLSWKPAEFDVRFESVEDKHGDLLVRFPSAIESKDPQNDLVAMEWYQARGADKSLLKAPAAVIVHESGSGMTVGRLIASGLSKKGVHAFMVQLPHYGKRRGPNGKPKGDQLVTALRQGIVDVRRAHDAVAAIPVVDSTRISLQGTSLGGFVAATTAGLDPIYHRVFILLAGGDLHGVMMNGKKDAEKMRKEMEQGGITEQELKDLLYTIEPLRLAHRMSPSKTWLFSGKYDDVVPLSHCNRLAEAAHLSEDHHITMMADHYSGVIYLPSILGQMHEHMIESE